MMTPDFENIEYEQYTNLKSRFDQYYQTTLYPFLKQKEDTRLKYVNRFWFLLLLSFFVLPMAILVIYFVNNYSEINIDWGIFYIIVAVAVFVLRGPFAKYRKEVKNDVMDLFVRFFDGFSYHQGAGLSPALLERSRIFPAYTKAKADDCFDGVYNDVALRVCEEHLEKEYRTAKGRRRVQTVFRGIAVEMGMKKPFKGQTIVLKDSGFFNKFKGFNDLERVKLEDVIFEKHFEVYSSDQIEARYLLTTAFMERILKLKELYKGKKIEISFYANKILLAIDTREDMFEPCSFFKTNLNKEKIDTVFEQFWTIFSVIHVLKLNQNTGM